MAMAADLMNYQTDFLFLLVGSNPLPNFVSAMLLAKKGGKVILLHTAKTGQVAANLKDAIDHRKMGITVEPREIDTKCSDRILREMESILEEMGRESSVGLNYTGGTKAMSVHTFRAVGNAFDEAVFSYLDARALSLVIDTKGELTKEIGVGQACPVELEEMLALHGFRRYSSKQELTQPDFCKVLAEEVSSNIEAYKDWKKWLEGSEGEANRGWLETLPTKEEYPELAKVIDAISKICGGKPSPELFAKGLGKDKLNSCKEFLGGTWLEEYTYCSVRQLAEDLNLKDLTFGIKPTPNSKKPQKFESDVVFIRGYQLYVVSCKASTKKSYSKLGLFEAFTRARQLGGMKRGQALSVVMRILSRCSRRLRNPGLQKMR